MANDYYTRVKTFLSGTKAKGSDVVSELDLVVAGLDKLPSQSRMDSGNTNYVAAGGTANAITIAMPGTAWTTYTGKDGNRISFKAASTNTGAVTANVDSIGTATIRSQSNTDLVSGAIQAGGIYDIVYQEAQGVFQLLTTDSTANANAAAGSAAAAAADAVSTAADAASTAADVAEIQGRQTMYIPASAMWRRATSGASRGFIETSSNKVMIATLDFDYTSDEFAQFSVQMPKGWDASTVSAVFVWSHPSTTTNFGVRFFIQGLALSDGDAADTAFGTAVGHTADTGGTTDDVYITPETSAITIAGTPAKSDFVIFQVYRDVDDLGDTLAVDARLHGISVFYDIDAYSDD